MNQKTNLHGADGSSQTLSPVQSQKLRFGFDYFTFVMGSGIVAVLAPKVDSHLVEPAKVLWSVTAGVLIVISLISIYKYVLKPRNFLEEMRDETRSHFFGAIPMAYSSVVNGVFTFSPHLFGASTGHVLFIAVLANCALSLVTAVSVTYHLFVHHNVELPKMSATWLLSIVPAEVAAASASFLIPHVSIAEGRTLLWVGYLMWGVSVPLALTVLVILFLRLALHKLPPANLATNSWLTLGPLGTGAAGILTLGLNSKLVLTGSMHILSTPLYAAGILGAFALFGYGVWWWITSIGVSLRFLLTGNYPFNFGWWAFTFPLGVLTTAAFALASTTELPAGLWLAKSMGLLLIVLWLLVATKTTRTVFNQFKATRRASIGIEDIEQDELLAS